METKDRHRLERHARRLEDLDLWRDARELRVERWRFVGGDGSARSLRLGEFWPEVALPVSLSAETEVPRSWAGEPVEIELWLGGEGFVRLSNGVTGGLNPFHRSFRISEKARGGERVLVEAEVVSKGLWGSHVAEPRLERASLVVPETGVRALRRDLGVVNAACAELDDNDVVAHLLDAVDAALRALDAGWPTAARTARARYLRSYADAAGDGLSSLPDAIAGRLRGGPGGLRSLWSAPPAQEEIEPLPEGARRAVEEARRVLARRLEEIGAEYPPVGRLALSGHAHIDLAWLWPLAETRRKARRTFSSVLGLMDRYEGFTFNQSSAQLYRWIEEDDPELFGRIRERVEEGRWEPVGGSWTEPDCQVTGGEAFVRQLLYGQSYFEGRFGRRSPVAWLPDVFGFSPGIPQLLWGAGITGFFTAKLKWSETNRFPHDLFAWEGIDGSRVVAHCFRNPGMDYNGDIVPFDVLGVWRNFGGKRRHPESLFTFGWGDGGGGPSEEMLEKFSRLESFPALPRLRMTRIDDFFDTLPRDDLPEWVGELYLELHRGTLTSQSVMKRLNRAAEHRLLEAEAFAWITTLFGSPYPAAELEAAWKMLLLNQFHDILPGTSVREVYEEANSQLEETLATAEGIRDDALRRLGGESGEALLVANASLHPACLTTILPGEYPRDVGVVGTDGGVLPTQQTREGLLVHAPDRAAVPGLGWTTLRTKRGDGAEGTAQQQAASVSVRAVGGGATVENGLLGVEIDAGGTLGRVYDREVGREVLAGRGNQLWAYVDRPREWEAWDVEEDYEAGGAELPGAGGVEILESGPLRGAVRVERYWRDSRITQTYRLLSGSRRLDVLTEVDWCEKQVLLRALFPLSVRAREATFETMYGAQGRPTHRNTSWEEARFEVSAHRFVDLSEPGYGVALLNDGKYGHSARGGVLGLSLLRGPLYPDPFADEGYHRFTYSLFPHPGDWTEAGVTREAFALNSPLVAAPGSPAQAEEYGFVSPEGLELALGSLKEAQDGRGAILRLYEPHGARGGAALRFAFELESAERVNLLEEPDGGPLEVRGSEVRLHVRPFEVISLRVRPRAL